jgi:hypothetical protein
MEWLMTEEPPALPSFFAASVNSVNVSQSDIRAYVRGELGILQRDIRQALNRRLNAATRVHLQDALARIDHILDPED